MNRTLWIPLFAFLATPWAARADTEAVATEPPAAPEREPAPAQASDPANSHASLYFCSYKPNYFAVGRGTSKFQFSFRYAIWDFGRAPGACGSGGSRRQLQFAYTQKTLWRLFEDSSPFEENNYNPEFYYRENVRWGWLRALRLGLEHESNGRMDPESRSWDRLYVLASIGTRSDSTRSSWLFRLYPKLWYILPSSDLEAAPLDETYGYFELVAAVRTPETRGGTVEVEVEMRKGGDPTQWERGSLQVGASYNPWPLRRDSRWRFTPYFYVQFFIGYGETLQRADRSSTNLRGGFRFLI